MFQHLNELPINPTVSRLFVHPGYHDKDDPPVADVGILELERPVQLSDTIKPACITTTAPILGDILITSGWGKGSGWLLQGTEMKVGSSEECIYNNFKFNDEIICVKDEYLDSTVCYGDSGG